MVKYGPAVLTAIMIIGACARAPSETPASGDRSDGYRLLRVLEVAGRQGIATDGERIVLGMPKGLYPGYEREIHEVYVYRIPDVR